MKNIIKTAFAIGAAAALFSGCAEDNVFPQDGSVVPEQIIQVPTALQSYTSAMDAFMIKYDVLAGASVRHWDFGYGGLMIQRDLMGQDLIIVQNYRQLGPWYEVNGMGPDYVYAQMPWRWYYKQIYQANTIIEMIPDPEAVSDEVRRYLGRAYAYRAFCYLDLGRLFIQGRYIGNEDGVTVPIVTPETEDPLNNPRAKARDLYALILDDLGKAETYLAGYNRPSTSVPDQSVVRGLLARTHLDMGNWGEAESYAKAARAGYTALTQAQWGDRSNGFNTPTNNNSWMWCFSATANDDMVKSGIINWTSHMCAENTFGYNGIMGQNYAQIDRHLYDLIPETDFRKTSYVAPGATPAQINSNFPQVGQLPTYTSIKFRPSLGDYANYDIGAASSTPIMRMEEMMLIEAEAAGRQDLNRGKQLLEAFVQTRNPAFVSQANWDTEFIEEIWLQRRIELWGEGFATFDLKRLDRPVIRFYEGTNHLSGSRYNHLDGAPSWLNFCIVRTEINNNDGISQEQNNPTPPTPDEATTPYVW